MYHNRFLSCLISVCLVVIIAAFFICLSSWFVNLVHHFFFPFSLVFLKLHCRHKMNIHLTCNAKISFSFRVQKWPLLPMLMSYLLRRWANGSICYAFILQCFKSLFCYWLQFNKEGDKVIEELKLKVIYKALVQSSAGNLDESSMTSASRNLRQSSESISVGVVCCCPSSFPSSIDSIFLWRKWMSLFKCRLWRTQAYKK